MTNKPKSRARRKFKLPEVLTQEEQIALLNQPNKLCPTGLRNYCMMRIMLDVGLRSSEAIKLSVQDINWTTGRLKVRQGKGQKDRMLWINEDLLEELGAWREVRPIQANNLFVTLKGEAINPRYLRAMVKRLGKKANIAKDIHPHMLRHSFATDLYRETKNIRLVQKALGHADLSTTMIYTHIVDDELEDALKSFRS